MSWAGEACGLLKALLLGFSFYVADATCIGHTSDLSPQPQMRLVRVFRERKRLSLSNEEILARGGGVCSTRAMFTLMCLMEMLYDTTKIW